MKRWRTWTFVLMCGTALGLALGYVAWRARGTSSSPPPRDTQPLEWLDERRPGVLFISAEPDETFHTVVYVPIDAPDGPWYVTPFSCERVYFRGGRGACLTMSEGLAPSYRAAIFNDRFRRAHEYPLTGPPSRARVSPDGRRAAFTVFESGHSYAESGFSTRTTIVDTASGSLIADLEAFTASRNGGRFSAVDFNYWGVTFAADGNRFYATLGTGAVNYLVEGDVDARTTRVLREGVECPSLSPDGRRIAFKRRIDGRAGIIWRIVVLDLETGEERVLGAEERSVDDQVEWLDDKRVLYFLPGADGNNIWSLRTDADERPRVLIRGGFSPVVVRPPAP